MVPANVLLVLLTATAATGSKTPARDALNCPFLMSRSDGGASSTIILTVADLRDPLLEYLRSRHLQAALQAASENKFVRRDRTDRIEYRDVQTAGGSTFLERVQLHRWTPSADAGSDGGFTHEVLSLLLVPEHPTAGVDKESLQAALRCASHPESVKVLGPTFSGGAWSLATSLKDAGVSVLSGSATGDRVGIAFAKSHVPFRRTVHSNGALASGLASFLHSMTGEDVPFALLVEASSDYGQSFRESLSAKLGQHNPRYNPLVLPFPLHVAWILGEDSDLLPSRTDESEDAHPSVDGGARHVHFARASAIERASARASLGALLTTVAREAVPYVGIVATDVRDRLFLAQEVHQLLPDVRVVLFEADVLYAAGRTTDLPPGTLVVSTYSLAANHRPVEHTGGKSPFQQFESDASLGVYNAMLLLLEPPGAGRPPPPLLEYGAPLGSDGGINQPPVWISLLGARSSWPLAVEAGGDDPSLELDPRAHATKIPNRAPTQFDLVATFCALVLLIILSWFFFGPQPAELEARRSAFPALADPLSGEWGPTVAYCGMFSAWLGTLFLLGNLLVHAHPAGHAVIHWMAVGLVLFAAAGATLAVGSSLSFLALSEKRPKQNAKRNVFERLFTPNSSKPASRRWLVIGPVFPVSLALLALSLRQSNDAQSILARSRTTHLASGVSVLPCLLLVLAAVTVLALFYVAYRAVLTREELKPLKLYGQSNISARRSLILGSALAVVVPASLLIWPDHPPFATPAIVKGLLALLYLSPVALTWPYAIAFIRVLELQESSRGANRGAVDVEASVVRSLALAPLLAAPLLLVASWSFPFVGQQLMILVFATLEVVFILVYFTLILVLQALKPRETGAKLAGWDVIRLGLASIPTVITLVGLKLPNTGNAVISWLQQLGAVVK